jgi:hypothetical protein
MNNEPVAWKYKVNKNNTKTEGICTDKHYLGKDGIYDIEPLYTHPSEHDLGIAEAIGFDKGYKAATAKVFTDEEVDAIYSAMGDYADYGDEETELANSIRNKLS